MRAGNLASPIERPGQLQYRTVPLGPLPSCGRLETRVLAPARAPSHASSGQRCASLSASVAPMASAWLRPPSRVRILAFT